MNNTMQEMMREATRLTQAGQLLEATAAIQRALSASAPASPADLPAPINPIGLMHRAWTARTGSAGRAPDKTVLDGYVFEGPDAATTAAAGDDIITDAFISGTHTHASLNGATSCMCRHTMSAKNCRWW